MSESSQAPRNFKSDNIWGAAPEVAHALAQASQGPAVPYGDDPVTEAIEQKFREIFEHDTLRAYMVTTGTAANSIALSSLVPPYGVVYGTDIAHIACDECGAPEFFTGGARMQGLPHDGGKLQPIALETYIKDIGSAGFVHAMQPAAVSITQATEFGTVYTIDEISALAKVAHDHTLPLHMDGARFTNALVSLDVSPAEMTWRAGVDVLSFGATKNGAWSAEAVLVFNTDLAADIEYRRKRGGHLLSKNRFIAHQFQGFFDANNWLRYARHANDMAQRLGKGLNDLGFQLAYPVQANALFIILPNETIEALQDQNFLFYDWPLLPSPQGSTAIRLVTGYATAVESVDAFLRVCRDVTLQKAD